MNTRGAKTSEFGSVIGLAVLTAVNKKLGLEISDEVLMCLAGAVSAYIGSRAWVKGKAAAL